MTNPNNPFELLQSTPTHGREDDPLTSIATDANRRAQAHAAMAGAHGHLAENPGEGVAPESQRGPDGPAE